MTTPGQSKPDGAYALVDVHTARHWNESSVNAVTTGGAANTAFQGAQAAHTAQVLNPLDNVYTIATTAQGSANTAISDAAAAANLAATADSTAASASARASYWEAEFVLSSSEVQLGTNELLIGLCQNVPVGLTREITDMHVALVSQVAGLSFELKKMNATGTSSSVLGTYPLSAGVIRANWSGLGFFMNSRERVYPNVSSITGTTPPVVMQVLLFGVMS